MRLDMNLGPTEEEEEPPAASSAVQHIIRAVLDLARRWAIQALETTSVLFAVGAKQTAEGCTDRLLQVDVANCGPMMLDVLFKVHLLPPPAASARCFRVQRRRHLFCSMFERFSDSRWAQARKRQTLPCNE